MPQEKKNFFDQYDAPATQGVQVKSANPMLPGQVTGQTLDNYLKGARAPYAGSDARLDNQGKSLSNRDKALDVRVKADNPAFDRERDLRSAFEAQPAVKTYKDAATSLGVMLRTPDTSGGDIQIIYNYIKSQGPGPVAQGELDLAQGAASFQEALEQKYGKITSSNRLPPRVRMELIEASRQAVAAKKAQFDQIYTQYRGDAERSGLNPQSVTGPHPADAVRPLEEKYIRAHGGTPQSANTAPAPASDEAVRDFIINYQGLPLDQMREFAKYKLGRDITNLPEVIQHLQETGKLSNRVVTNEPKGYEASYLSQGLSGVNEGLAGVLGAPVDIAAGVLNLGSTGLNALANTDIPKIENPTLGSQQIEGFLGSLGSIANPTDDPSKQFVRRMGESVGAAALPAGYAAGTSGQLARGAGQLLAGVGGGLGGATAQQAFPNNPVAEFAGETLGGLGAGAGALGLRQRAAQRAIEAKVPTIPQLKEQAGNLYQQAEQRGVTATPEQTENLRVTLGDLLGREGMISPTGRLSEVNPKVREAYQLVNDYAGQPMAPTQLQTVRKVAADGLSSPESSERRIAGLVTDAVDEWARPLAPELPQARNIASRYLTAETLERARELAGARAGQFSGSGFENALRTEYRGLDRANIKGSQRFNNDVSDAVERVSRGTTGSNIARGIGKLAPTGVVSGMGSGLPALAGYFSGGPVVGAAVGGTLAGIGTAGRVAATHMGLRNATLAELVARNGGALPQAPYMTLGDLPDAGLISGSEIVKYLQNRQ